jgi:hypothetical protein
LSSLSINVRANAPFDPVGVDSDGVNCKRNGARSDGVGYQAELVLNVGSEGVGSEGVSSDGVV